jgi:hypothetical protein
MISPLPDATLLSELDLCARSRSLLLTHPHLVTVGDLRSVSDYSLTRQPNFGRRSLIELREACGDSVPFNSRGYPLTLAKAIGPERAEVVIAMRAAAAGLYQLAALIEQAARKASGLL